MIEQKNTFEGHFQVTWKKNCEIKHMQNWLSGQTSAKDWKGLEKRDHL